MSKLTKHILKAGEVVPFTASTPRYGNAEFIICAPYRRGILRELFIYPAQQPDAKQYFYVPLTYKPLHWSIHSWTHKGIEEPRIWMHFWCKEHIAGAMRLYAPRQAKNFSVHMLSNLSIIFSS
jgi:hypothetical protein